MERRLAVACHDVVTSGFAARRVEPVVGRDLPQHVGIVGDEAVDAGVDGRLYRGRVVDRPRDDP